MVALTLLGYILNYYLLSYIWINEVEVNSFVCSLYPSHKISNKIIGELEGILQVKFCSKSDGSSSLIGLHTYLLSAQLYLDWSNEVAVNVLAANLHPSQNMQSNYWGLGRKFAGKISFKI